MIFKEKAILLMILLETSTQDDWLSIAEESDAYGYAIIKKKQARTRTEENTENTRIIDTPEGQFTITFTPKPKKICRKQRNHSAIW